MAKKNYNLIAGVSALVAVILIVAVAGYFISKPKAPVIQGQAEASEYRISGKVPGRIEEMYAKEGQRVQKGDTLVYIDSPEVRAKLAQANAARSAAQAQSSKAKAGARSEEIAGAYNLWQSSIVQEDVMKKSFDRIQRLYDQKVVSAQKYDEVKAKYDAAVATSAAAKSKYDMAVNGARQEDKIAAQALVAQAEGAIMEVESYLSELYLTSPVNGTVSDVFPMPGELVGTGSPIMTVVDLDDIWFTFNVREDRLADMTLGSKLTLIVPALGGKEVQATVSHMAVRESYATWKATKDTDSYDAKTFEVKAVPDSKVEGLLPGMTVLIK